MSGACNIRVHQTKYIDRHDKFIEIKIIIRILRQNLAKNKNYRK